MLLYLLYFLETETRLVGLIVHLEELDVFKLLLCLPLDSLDVLPP